MKNEPLKITYSYWDGQGHRRTLTIRKGDNIGQFLQKVKEQLQPDFRELRPVFPPPEWRHAHLHLSNATFAWSLALWPRSQSPVLCHCRKWEAVKG